MHLLITGGAGFIGRHIAGAALAAGHDVRVLDDLSTSSAADVPDGAALLVGDVRDPDLVDLALRGVDAVSHQAAMVGLGVDLDDLPRYASVNDVGTAVLVAAMARSAVRRLVLAGSMVVYGEGGYACRAHGPLPAPPRDEADLAAGRFEPRCPACAAPLSPTLVGEQAPADPRNGYAVTKYTQELLTRTWARETDSACTVLRYHNVYGPGLPRDTPYAGVAAIFGSALARGQAPQVFEDGGQRRDFVHVRDVASANVIALEATGAPGPEPGCAQPGRQRVFNVASGTPRTVHDLAAALSLADGGPAPVVTGRFRLGDVRHVTADTALIRSELGWAPQVTWTDGIAELAAELAGDRQPSRV